MLKQLSINNYALIDTLQIEFSAGLNILTGETGAGKSIILGALSLILGQRAESRYFFNQQKKCIIEGHFSIASLQLKGFFDDSDLDYEDETILRREISADGKSRAFINDSPVNLNQLKALGERLIDIHSQHATAEINDPAFQLMVVDAVAKHEKQMADYQSRYKTYRADISRLKQLQADSEKAKADLDYYQFQFDELEKANLDPDEQEPLEQELNTLNNAEEIKRNLLNASFLLEDGESNALAMLKEASQQLTSLEKFNTAIAELKERLGSVIIELKDISAEAGNLEQQTQTNEVRAEEVNTRLSMIYNLQKKHRVNTNAELLTLQNDLSGKIAQAIFGDEEIEKLQADIAAQKSALEELAKQLNKGRLNAIPEIETQVMQTLAEMGMASAQLKVSIASVNELTATGTDQIRFTFTANKGHALSEMSKVASGGELSRLMLSIKSLIAKNTALPTIIFDEIDTGVSGQVADQVGRVMEQLTKNLQVITITHLPQIASKGDSHFFVYKDDDSETTKTRIRQLTNDERVTEIAKMLSGDKPGESALQNARELLGA
ncbi:DNA repair protein RecN [Mucilaginibacter ginkgonis]|uniref:DNA repair protein RecN n=1 Tax=Mucilaginibacter ginkgonis TaxID=2682091 RepID=A0A6I4I7M1_9SPHI|nr:DNA repair protein RecN [Mucilaginibacter ginkgonis]QQL49239.1 DNA repair protein RecN [Mucilaginibacter ginkgonis]